MTVGKLTSSLSAMAVRDIGLSRRMISRIEERLIALIALAVMDMEFTISPLEYL